MEEFICPKCNTHLVVDKTPTLRIAKKVSPETQRVLDNIRELNKKWED